MTDDTNDWARVDRRRRLLESAMILASDSVSVSPDGYAECYVMSGHNWPIESRREFSRLTDSIDNYLGPDREPAPKGWEWVNCS